MSTSTSLQLLRTYWTANSALNAAVPYTRVYFGFAPETLVMPYVLIQVVGSYPTFTTCNAYIEEFTLQFDVYDTSLANCESVAGTIQAQFDWVKISSDSMAMRRTNYLAYAESEIKTPNANVYHVVIEYAWLRNKSY